MKNHLDIIYEMRAEYFLKEGNYEGARTDLVASLPYKNENNLLEFVQLLKTQLKAEDFELTLTSISEKFETMDPHLYCDFLLQQDLKKN